MRKEEEERARKIKEEKDAVRRRKLEDQRLKEEAKAAAERERLRLQEAREYYQRGLLIKYGMVALGKNVESARMLEEAADSQRVRGLLRQGLRWLKAGAEESRLEARRREQKMEYIAIRYAERNTML
jgi:ribulose-5-phosphate 4-epimerase/fuculose-1-phosphate aldolase